MKPVGPLLLLLAGVILGWIALAHPSRSYGLDNRPEIPEVVPVHVSEFVPDGYVVRKFDVEGICCTGCAGKLFVAADDVHGVVEAAVDPEAKRVETIVPTDFDVAVLESALTFEKYSAHLATSGAE